MLSHHAVPASHQSSSDAIDFLPLSGDEVVHHGPSGHSHYHPLTSSASNPHLMSFSTEVSADLTIDSSNPWSSSFVFFFSYPSVIRYVRSSSFTFPTKHVCST
jgi:hypothetical protein